MSARRMKVSKCPSDVLTMTNRAIVNPGDFDKKSTPHIDVRTGPGQHFVFTIECDGKVSPGTVAFSLPQRKWATLSLNQDIDVSPYQFSPEKHYMSSIVLEVDFFNKKNTTTDPFDTDQMAKEFSMQFPNQAFTVGMQCVFNFQDRKLLQINVKDCEATDLRALQQGEKVKPHKVTCGLFLVNSGVIWEKMEGSSINLTGKSKAKVERTQIINPDWDFSKMGIGGLDTEFNAIFRRAFASRVFPPEIMDQLGCKHVKGILLFGPPGTGKTLMARQIGQMLNSREPKIVNGPQILDKYVGESEANIRRLFEDAEEEEKRLGPNSGLHIIIFDEIDAICKARGSSGGESSGVNDTVVNQLLSKIDGVDQLNNILVIGMTNRRDMMDDALLRPGRLEVQIEIGLPKEKGRTQILHIHTKKMVAHKKLGSDVDIPELAGITKNFSGAELEGLVRAAQSCALNRLVKADSKVEVDVDAAEKLMVGRSDFLHALDNDVKPAFGAAEEKLELFISRGIINWGDPVQGVLDDGELLIQQAASASGDGMVSVLLEGAPNSGKTALAASLAKQSGFPFVKICSPDDMVGFTESAKCKAIKKVFDDAYRSMMSCVVVDNIERLLDYGPIGPRYSNLTLQALLVLLKKSPPKGRRLLVFATTSRRDVLEHMEMTSAFTDVLHVANLTTGSHLMSILTQSDAFSKEDLAKLAKQLQGRKASIGVKKLLGLIDMVKQMEPRARVNKLMCKLEDEQFIDLVA